MPKSSMLTPGTRVRVEVPGSTSNLGPGFDAFGCALAIANRFEFTLIPDGDRPVRTFRGPAAGGIPLDESNLAIRAMAFAWGRLGCDAGLVRRVSLSGEIHVPQARGLGSSSTAIVAGVAAAAAFLRRPPGVARQLALATEMEGHPDNVSAALLGGFVASIPGTDPIVFRRYRVHRRVAFIVVIPDYEVRTAEARAALPDSYPRSEAIANLARTPLVLEAFRTGDLADLWTIMDDRIHQPFRAPLYPGLGEMREAARKAGAAGFCVSGAGPAMLAIAAAEESPRIARALRRALAALPFGGSVRVLPARAAGARVRIHPPVG